MYKNLFLLFKLALYSSTLVIKRRFGLKLLLYVTLWASLLLKASLPAWHAYFCN